MSTDRERVIDQLRAAERGESAGWTTYPRQAWWPVAYAVWAATFILTLGYLDGATGNLAIFAHLGLALALVWVDRRQRGTSPTGMPPRELSAAMGVLVGGALVIFVGAFLDAYYAAPWVAALVAALATLALMTLYGRMYDTAATRARQRLA